MARKTVKTDVRHPYYEASDKLSDLRWRLHDEPTMVGDAVLASKIKALGESLDAIRTHLTANYVWD